MKVLFATSEAAPFLKTGGLGDVLGALPKAVAEQGIDARVIMPLYSDIPHTLKSQMEFIDNFYNPISIGLLIQTSFESVHYLWKKDYKESKIIT